MVPDPAATDADLLSQVLVTLRERGNRATTARRILLGVLLACQGHRTAEELAARVQDRAPDIHLTTIYRNLDELERIGIVDRTRLRNGPATYHLGRTAHGHLVCEDCGSLSEVPDDLFNGLARAAADRYGFTIKPAHFAATGRCSNCQPENRRSRNHDETAPSDKEMQHR